MAKRKHSPEQIINKPRAMLSQRAAARRESTRRPNYRYRSRYGGMTIAEAKDNKRLREENTRLKHAVADSTLDNQILQ